MECFRIFLYHDMLHAKLRMQIRGLENKLATEPYKHVEEKHRRKMIEHRTTEMAVTDLDKYWTALDKVRSTSNTTVHDKSAQRHTVLFPDVCPTSVVRERV